VLRDTDNICIGLHICLAAMVDTNHKKREWRKQRKYSEMVTEKYFKLVTERKSPIQAMIGLKYTELLRLYSNFGLFHIISENMSTTL